MNIPSHVIAADKFLEAREWFLVNGISLGEWADHHNVERSVLYSVLSGKSRCIRGESHRVAVLLGLKPASSIARDVFSDKPNALGVATAVRAYPPDPVCDHEIAMPTIQNGQSQNMR